MFFKERNSIRKHRSKCLSFLVNAQRACGKFSNKMVLDIGADNFNHLITSLVKDFKASKAFGVNVHSCDSGITRNVYHYKSSATQTSFSDNFFDIALSLNTFEHIINLDKALEETYRVLKPGGILYSDFGPIWSSPKGHKSEAFFEYHPKKERSVTLPPYAHLLLTKEQARDYVAKSYPFLERSLKEEFINNIYENQNLNKMLYLDYLSLFKKCSFEIVSISSFPSQRYCKNEIIKLNKKHKQNAGFFLQERIVVILKKHER